MHRYLRSIGFQEFDTRKKIKALVEACIKDPTTKEYVTTGKDSTLVMFHKTFAENIGITVCGEYDEDNNFIYDYYFPYIRGSSITSYEDITIERHSQVESYAGVCDDVKVGVTLIFYLQNMISYLRYRYEGLLPVKGTSLTLSALASVGTIVLPIVKNNRQLKKIKNASDSRNQLIAAARKGDEEAIESLTLEDMDTYTAISKRIRKEDIYSLVDTSFIPYGVECDQYSILGEIIEVQEVKNWLTNEILCQLKIYCNELIIDVCIHKNDLLGEPQVGRRFKGNIWLQGIINFPE